MDNVRQNGTYHNHTKPSSQSWQNMHPLYGHSLERSTEGSKLKLLPRLYWALGYLGLGCLLYYLIG